ncbi:MAG: UvrD-helicase domain-containing protein, partial [Prevotella sp.]|nr:UvrD-helicase domain-containing protein [Prevotella sp.]
MIQTRESDLPSLTVYKASAGSGKTFRQAVEYIKLLIHNPQSYRQILAVTFTNKATEEMKMRILSQLYGIWRQLDDSDDYMTVVAGETGLSREHIAEKAGVALHLLLHNYSYFRVETIDSFFQSVLRNLARELDLTANLRISLNDSQVEELVVDQLIESLSATDVLLQWLMTYIMDNIGDDKSWNVIWQIKKFGKTIFRDYYKKDGKELNRMLTQKDFFENYTAMLRQMRQQARERMMTIAASFFDTLAEEGLDVTNLSYGKQGVASLFYKLQAGVFDESVVGTRVLDCQANAEKWCSKTEPHRDHIVHLAQHQLGDILNYALSERPRQWKLYKTADLTLRHLNQLRLLNSIEEKVRELNDGANRFLLSDTQQLL